MSRGFAVPALSAWCEAVGIAYTIGLPTNPRLEALAAPLSLYKMNLLIESDIPLVSMCHVPRNVFETAGRYTDLYRDSAGYRLARIEQGPVVWCTRWR